MLVKSLMNLTSTGTTVYSRYPSISAVTKQVKAQHVLHKEAVGVVPRQEDILDHSKDTLLLEAQGLTPHHRGVDQDRSTQRKVEMQCRGVKDAVQGSSRLHQFMCHNPSAIASGAHTFSHKVSREVALKKVLVLKGVVQLAVRHAATLKPAVKHLLHPVQLTLALLAGDGDVVYEVPVQGGTPEAAPADRPVMCICQPVVEALLLDIGWNPVGLGIVGHQLILDLGHLHKPAGHSLQHSKGCAELQEDSRGVNPVDEGGLRAPAEGVAMGEDTVVILSKEGCLVHDASTGIAGHIPICHNPEGPFVAARGRLQTGKHSFTAPGSARKREWPLNLGAACALSS
ncbi:MAG: hypothetical protein FRX49_00169 [Trebouxia sp. A1-2]|nr:MAG: hypothetical protein FRX49_00169 [Trebouxia sp. A1-2]